MAILNIQLRDDLQIVARARATERGYASVEEYLADLIEADGAVARSEELEAEILDRVGEPRTGDDAGRLGRNAPSLPRIELANGKAVSGGGGPNRRDEQATHQCLELDIFGASRHCGDILTFLRT